MNPLFSPPLFIHLFLSFLLHPSIPHFLQTPEPAVRQQSGDGDSQHAGEKHHAVEVWLPFHPAGPAPPRLQRHDEQQRPGLVTHTHTHTNTHTHTHTLDGDDAALSLETRHMNTYQQIWEHDRSPLAWLKRIIFQVQTVLDDRFTSPCFTQLRNSYTGFWQR